MAFVQTMLGYQLPSKYKKVDRAFIGQEYQRSDGMKVVETTEVHQPENYHWHHVSCSFADKLPSYEDLQEIRKVFIGEGMTSVMIFPPEHQYINYHPFCLHLYACLDADPWPDVGSSPDWMRGK
jgi:hypothetical protein